MKTRNIELDELIDAVDLESFFEREGIDYRLTPGARGTQFNLRECPCCGKSEWKVYLNAEMGIGNCFSGSCQAKFSKYKIIREVAHITDKEMPALLRGLALEQGWRPPRTYSVATRETAAWKLPEHLTFPIHGKNLAYLENRGITLDVIRYFGLLYCHKGIFPFINPAGKSCFQRYDRRVLIPIYDLDGNLVNFQGRDITGTAEKKYLFPPGLSSTGCHLYNGHNAVGTNRIVINEGVFDVAATKIALDTDPALRDVIPVGTFGKHLSYGHEDSQLNKFIRLKNERGIDDAVIMWDGEIAATDDAVKAAEMLHGIGYKVRIAALPDWKDPNEVPPQVVVDAYYKARPYSRLAGLSLSMGRRISQP